MNEWLTEKLDNLKTSTTSLQGMWKLMGELSEKTPAEISLEKLKSMAMDLSCDIFKESVNQTNLLNQASNSYETNQELASTLKDIMGNTDSIISNTKELAQKSDIEAAIIKGIDQQLQIAAESGKLSSLANNIKEKGKQLALSSASGYIGDALDKIGVSTDEVSNIAGKMNSIISGDPRKLVIDSIKGEIADQVASSFGPLNAVTAGIASVIVSAGDDSNGEFAKLDELGNVCIDGVKEFAQNSLAENIPSEAIDGFDFQNSASANGGSLHGLANSILEIGKSCLAGATTDYVLEQTLGKLGDSASGLMAAADNILSISQEDPRNIDLGQIKNNFGDKLTDSFGPINSIAGFASQLNETDEHSGSQGSSFGDISKFTEKAVSQIKTASESAETSKDIMDSFNLMQDVAKSGGKLKAYGYGILALVTDGESEADDPSLLKEFTEIKQGANDLLSKAENLWDMTQKDPKELLLDELKSQVKAESESILGPITNISGATSRAIATGLLSSSLSGVFNKIKDNVSKAESSQSELKSSAQTSSQTDSAPSESEQNTNAGKTEENKTAKTSSDNTESPKTTAAEENTQATSDENKTPESTTAANDKPGSDKAKESTESNNTATDSVADAGGDSKSEAADQGESKPDINSDATEDKKSYADATDKTDDKETKTPGSDATTDSKTNNDIDQSTDTSVADKNDNDGFNTDSFGNNNNPENDSLASGSEDNSFFDSNTESAQDVDNLSDTNKTGDENDKSKLSNLI